MVKIAIVLGLQKGDRLAICSTASRLRTGRSMRARLYALTEEEIRIAEGNTKA